MSLPRKNYSAYLTARVRRLNETLADLRERVRVAVAEELGKVIAEAVRDVVTLAVGRRPPIEPTYRGPNPRYAEDGWDDAQAWEQYESEAAYAHHGGVEVRYLPSESGDAPPDAAHPSARKSAALAIGVGVACWCLRRRGSTAGSLALGIAAGMIALSGGPLTRAGLAALATARDLLGISESLHLVGNDTSESR